MSELDIPDEQKKVIQKLTNYAKRLERLLGAEAVIVIGVFKDGTQLRLQDAGRFPMPPTQFYTVMQAAHENGLMSDKKKPKPKPTSRIIKPH